MITTGLIIAEPWIGRILAGEKTWEMRSTKLSKRGPVALIRKGSGKVVGIAELVGCTSKLDRAGMISNIDKHTIPENMITSGEVDKWCWGWQLANVRSLPSPVPYEHPNGAVIWVKLDPEVSRLLSGSETQSPRAAEVRRTPMPTPKINVETRKSGSGTTSDSTVGDKVPVAKDGSRFSRELGSRGYFQVGSKGDEKKYETYEQALAALKRMPTARWRRPNSQGNWGIVGVVRWE